MATSGYKLLDRDLSILRFNARVMELATRPLQRIVANIK